MFYVIAEVTPEASALGNWVIIGVAVLAGISVLVNLASYFATRREVTALENRMTAHVNDTKGTTDQLFAKIGGVERGLRRDFDSEMTQLHEKVNDVAKGVAKLEGTTEGHTQMLHNIDAKLDRAIERRTT